MALDTPITIRKATPADLPNVQDFYIKSDYTQKINSEDTILITEEGDQICAALRLVVENDVMLLRGARVAPTLRRQGIGTQLLIDARSIIGDRECYCIPYRSLVSFYSQIGFVEIDLHQAPEFLQARCADYRENLGLDVVVMHF